MNAIPIRTTRPAFQIFGLLFLFPGAILLLMGLTFIFDTCSQQTVAERGIEQAVGGLFLIVGAISTSIGAFLFRRRSHLTCSNCNAKLPKRAQTCPNCHASITV